MKFREKLYLFFAALSVTIIVLTLISSLQKTSGTGDSVFAWGDGMMTVVVCTIFALIQFICLFTFKPRKNIRTLGFYLLHIGLLVLLLGCFLYYNAGTDNDEDGIKDNLKYVQVVPSDKIYSEYATLGFGIGITDAGVTYYRDGTPKYYYADMIVDLGTGESAKKITLSVNHPHHENGWKIYLMDYNDTTGQVTLMFKRDPGEYLTSAGIWMVIIGTFLMCFVRRRKAGDAV